MKTISMFASAVLLFLCLAGCSSSTAPMAELCNVYMEIAENNQRQSDAYQAVYKASKEEQQGLMEKATAISKEVMADNEKLAEKAAQLGKQLQGTEIKCEASPSLGYKIENAVFATVDAQPKFANIIVEANVTGQPEEKPYFIFKDSEGNVVYKTIGSLSDGKVLVNFRITIINKGPELAGKLAKVTSMSVVTQSEYENGVDMSATAEPVADTVETEAVAEPEPAYEAGSENESAGKSVVVEGVAIQNGANLAETLKKFKRITWDYNADFGVSATVGNVWIVIDDADLTAEGQNVINAIPSDIADNIKFSVDYIKPSAKIKRFEVQ